MDAVDWSGLGVLAALMVGSVGYLARQINRLEDRMNAGFGRVDGRFDQMSDAVNARFDRVDARFDRLEERYVRHLELHATTHP